MKSEIEKAVKELVRKSKYTDVSIEAMQFTQAVANLVNALVNIKVQSL